MKLKMIELLKKRLKEKRLSHKQVWSKNIKNKEYVFLINSGFEDFFKKYGYPKIIDGRDLNNSWYVLDYTDEQMLTYNILHDFREIISKHL